MHLTKVLAVAAAGLGLAWGAQQLTGGWRGGPAALQADAESPSGQRSGEAEVAEMSEAEIQAELDRIAREAGEPGGDELEEFRASKPLAADLAIALPSDI